MPPGPVGEFRRHVLVKEQGQALGGAACLDEFRERRDHDVQVPSLQAAPECRARVAGDQRIAEADGIAGEGEGVLVVHIDASVFGHVGSD